MPHQTRAVEKFTVQVKEETKFVRVAGLFMEMGTGKTLTAIKLVFLRADRISKVIWVCPVSTKETIRKEILKHTTVKDIYVFDDKTDDSNMPNVSWYIVGLESISQSDRATLAFNALLDNDTCVIVDESSFIAFTLWIKSSRETTKPCFDIMYESIPNSALVRSILRPLYVMFIVDLSHLKSLLVSSFASLLASYLLKTE